MGSQERLSEVTNSQAEAETAQPDSLAEVSSSATQPASPARSAGSSAATDSDPSCSCCPQLCDPEQQSQSLTQRRSSQPGLKRPLLALKEEAEEDSQSCNKMRQMQEQVLWIILLLACIALVLSLFRLESPQSLLTALGAVPAQVLGGILPQGPLVWKFQWRVLGKPDPRPLWNPDLLGSATDWPHGSAAEFAAAFDADHIHRVAVVGNGPLSEAQREEIERADRIVRFNAMNNRQADERVDVWVVRHNNIPPFLFWGFQQLEDVEVESVLQHAKAVLFLGGSSRHNVSEMHHSVDKIQFWFPDMTEKQTQQVNFTEYWDLYNKIFSKNSSTTIETADTMPSSGLLGLLAVLGAVKRNVYVDLYGFNWSSKSYTAHKMNQEELIVRALGERFPNMAIHPTACNALYSCDSLCDTGQFRLAVDQKNCRAQLSKARQGVNTRFIDQHTIRNLDWYPDLKKELSAAQHDTWVQELKASSSHDGTTALLRSAERAAREDEEDDYDDEESQDTPWHGKKVVLQSALVGALSAHTDAVPSTASSVPTPGPELRPLRRVTGEAKLEQLGKHAWRKMKHPVTAGSSESSA